MNFGMLKNMVENLVQGYTCPFCSGKTISDQHIDIVGAAGNTVNIDMHCPSCDKHFMAKTEVVHMEIGNVSPEKLKQIQESLLALKGKMWGNLNIETQGGIKKQDPKILDENIMKLRSDMKVKNCNASDLFAE